MRRAFELSFFRFIFFLLCLFQELPAAGACGCAGEASRDLGVQDLKGEGGFEASPDTRATKPFGVAYMHRYEGLQAL